MRMAERWSGKKISSWFIQNECDLMLVELGHKLGKVQQAAAESVDLVDHHAVDPAGFDVGHESSKRGALHVATRESTIVVTIR